jgi:hypothetical protein
MRLGRSNRKAATMVECAVIYPLTFLLLLGLIVGAMGMFRYQQIANLARETARYASVHGAYYARDSGLTAPSPSDIYNAVIVPEAVDLDLTQLTYSITYNTAAAPYHMITVNGMLTPVTNLVTVTLTYNWVPEAFLGGVTFSSTSIMPMSY